MALALLTTVMVMATNSAALSEVDRDPSPRARRHNDASTVLSLPGIDFPAPVARPFLKWAGGKTRLLSSLLPFVPQRFANYHEPFLGGGAMFFKVRSLARERCYIADLNDELVNTWLVVKTQPNRLLAALNAYIGRDSR